MEIKLSERTNQASGGSGSGSFGIYLDYLIFKKINDPILTGLKPMYYPGMLKGWM